MAENAELRTIDLNIPEGPIRDYLPPRLKALRWLLPSILFCALGWLGFTGALKAREISKNQAFIQQAQKVEQELAEAQQQLTAKKKELDFVITIGRWMDARVPPQRFILDMFDGMSPDTRLRGLAVKLQEGYPQMSLEVTVEGLDSATTQAEIDRIFTFLNAEGYINNGDARPRIGPNIYALKGAYLIPRMEQRRLQ